MDKNDLATIKKILEKNNLGDVFEIIQFSTGRINRTYDIGGKFVVKIEGDLDFAKGVFNHQPEINAKLIAAGVKVPRIIDKGEIDGRGYLLMEKLTGTNINHDWEKFSSEKKEYLLTQIIEELKKIHSIRFDRYALPIFAGKEFENFQSAIENLNQFGKVKKELLRGEYREAVEFLEDFYEKNKEVVAETDSSVLIHNDMQFENILYDGERITGIIDWDWASQAPRDYEFWKIIRFLYNPDEFAENKTENPFPQSCKKIEEIGMFKKLYPEIFASKNLQIRLKIYFLDSLINTVIDYQDGRWSEGAMKKFMEKVDIFYKKDCLDELL